MSRLHVQEFDLNEARIFENNIVKKIDDIKKCFDRIQGTIESSQSWWKGGSEREFAEHFYKTRAEMERFLQGWLEDYRRLMNEIAASVVEDEDYLKSKIMQEEFKKFTAAMTGVAGAMATFITPTGAINNIMKPAEAQRLAGDQTNDFQCFDGDPVNMATGNFIYSEDDLEITGKFPLAFRRFYNSIGGGDSVLGNGWTHNFNIALILDKDDNSVKITFEDGHAEIYQKQDDGGYFSSSEHSNILTRTDKGYSLLLKSMEQYVFDGEGNLQCVRDVNGNETYYTYSDGLLLKVDNICGRLLFEYNNDKLLKRVSDNTGRKVELKYTDNRLVKVKQASGAVRQYEYNEQGLLNKIINPLGINELQNQYDENGRVVSQIFADDGVYAIDYNEFTTSVTEQNENKVQYMRDESFRTVKIIYEDSEESFGYNDNNKRVYYSDRNNNIRRFEYDETGNVLKSIDPHGNATSLEYNEFNKPVKVINADGGVIVNSYNERGNVTSSTDAIGRKVQFSNDERGFVVQMIIPDGSNNRIVYDERGNIVTLIDVNGNQTCYEYDSLNRVVKTIEPEGHVTRFEYNAKSDIVKAVNSEGNCRTYEYNAAGNLTKLTDFDKGITQYNYNAMGKVIEIINSGGDSTEFEYDKMWNIVSVTDPLGGKLSYEYNKFNRLVKTIDQEGCITCYEHDPNGNLTAVISPLDTRTEIYYDALDRQKEIREADGTVTKLEYDVLGNLTKITDPQNGEILRYYDKAGQLLSITDQSGNTTRYTYNALGQPETITDALGGKQEYVYYPGGQLKSVIMPGGEGESYEYDKNGNTVKVTDQLGNVTLIEYDCLNRIKTVTNPLGHSKKFKYDTLGSITSIINENGDLTKYAYSVTGELIEVIDALGHKTRYGYDKAGRMTQMRQYRLMDKASVDLDSTIIQTTSWERNLRGEVVKMTTPLGGEVCYKYDAMGNLTGKTDEDGSQTLYEYNNVNKLTKVMYADGKTVQLSYSPLRRLCELRDWLGTTTVESDNLGRTKKITDYEGRAVQYEWDALGRRSSVVYPDGSEVEYRYNTSGRLAGVLSETGETHYEYDVMGRVKERVMPGNIVTSYVTDPLGRLESLVHRKNGEVSDSFKYTYDPAGNITEIDKYRVNAEADSGLFKYSYDAVGRLVEAVSGQSSKQYRYDSLGNRISSVQNNIETKHSYNNRNQLIRTQENGCTRDYTYDLRGNLTQVTDNGIIKSSYIFDSSNRMVEAVLDNKRVEYTYNGFLKRVRRLEGMNDMRYILDLTRPYNDLLSTETSGNSQRFIWGNELVAAEGDNPLRYLNDHLGSPVRLIGENSDDALVYDEFGVPDVMNVNIHNPFGFTGYQYDEVTGLQFAQARYYEAGTGRFVSEDGARDGVNWYGYCAGNPVGYVDPMGLWGANVHKDKTIEWAKNLGFSDNVAEEIAKYNMETDSLDRGIGPIPLLGNQSYHFNTNKCGKSDSRMDLADYHLQKAIEDMKMVKIHHNITPNGSGVKRYIKSALKNLGFGLHALQDIEAHGNLSVPVGHVFDPFGAFYDNIDYVWTDSSKTAVKKARRWPYVIKDKHRTRLNDTQTATEIYLNSFLEGISEFGITHLLMK